MSIQTEISRIQSARDTLRTKAIELGIAQENAKLDALATAFEDIHNNGSVSATVREGDTYTIPKGYHDGSGTVSGVAGGGNYTLQSKKVTPSKKQIPVTADSGYYGLSDVTVEAIPVQYQDVSSVTAVADDVLATKTIVTSDGTVTAGIMPNNGTVTEVLTGSKTSVAIAKGYHNGKGTVSIVPETKLATPTKMEQTVTPTSGKVLTSVTVGAIPDKYQDVSNVTAVAQHVLSGDVFVNTEGTEVTGSMPNNGSVSKTLNTTTTTFAIPAGYHDGTGSISIVTETKTATPTKSKQTISPTTGKVLSSVTVNAIPAKFVDTTSATATAGDILDGKTAFISGVRVEGTMTNNGAMTKTIDGIVTTSVKVPAGYTTGGTVSLDTSIEDALAAI